MAQRPWSDRLSSDVRAWSDSIAALAVDALVDHGLVGRDDLDRATAIVSQEVFARLCLLDYPPAEEPEPPPSDA